MLKKTEQIGESPVAPARPDGPQAFRWTLAGTDLPHITSALRIGEATRASFNKRCMEHGLWPLPIAFHGPTPLHSHSYWLPEDADGDGYIDHVLLFAESGLPDALLPIMVEPGPLWISRRRQWQLLPDWMGHRVPGALFGPARRWRTVTAYVKPNWGRAGNRPGASDPVHAHISCELDLRSLPQPHAIRTGRTIRSGTTPVAAGGFWKSTNRGAAYRRSSPAGVEIVFDRPIWGPLALGYGCHCGLGSFEPIDNTDDELLP